ncbi:hypothetical protein FRC05_008738 [Tulasnella sp. 425]|nr:hypothetical protein FRC05_008738 [Tulasnella sp. 425]
MRDFVDTSKMKRDECLESRWELPSAHTSGPAGVAKEHVGVVLDERQLGAHVGYAGQDVASTGFGQEGLTAVAPQPLSERKKGSKVESIFRSRSAEKGKTGTHVSRALDVSTRVQVVRVQVLVTVEDQVGDRSVGVLDLTQSSRRAVAYPTRSFYVTELSESITPTVVVGGATVAAGLVSAALYAKQHPDTPEVASQAVTAEKDKGKGKGAAGGGRKRKGGSSLAGSTKRLGGASSAKNDGTPPALAAQAALFDGFAEKGQSSAMEDFMNSTTSAAFKSSRRKRGRKPKAPTPAEQKEVEAEEEEEEEEEEEKKPCRNQPWSHPPRHLEGLQRIREHTTSSALA